MKTDNTKFIIQKKFNSKEHAANYDRKAEKSKWIAPEIAFGLAFEHINSGESILDIGIGTGLSSKLFSMAGLEVHGMDFSEKMLEECRKKDFTTQLRQHDLCQSPYPYNDNSIDHAVSIGVFHLLSDLSLIFKEISRILKRKGVFIFSIIDCEKNRTEKRRFVLKDEKDNCFSVYRYGQNEIETLLEEYNFKLLKVLKFMAILSGKETAFKIYLCRR